MQNHLRQFKPMPSLKFIKVGYSYLLTRERIEFISHKLHSFMEDRKPYLQFGYSIRHLADDIEVPAYQLSAYLNREVGLNFNDFLNQFRVKYCQGLIQKGMDDQLNLKGLAFKCGFNNRNTLTTAFKKFTGFTPSCYPKTTLGGTYDGKVA